MIEVEGETEDLPKQPENLTNPAFQKPETEKSADSYKKPSVLDKLRENRRKEV